VVRPKIETHLSYRSAV